MQFLYGCLGKYFKSIFYYIYSLEISYINMIHSGYYFIYLSYSPPIIYVPPPLFSWSFYHILVPLFFYCYLLSLTREFYIAIDLNYLLKPGGLSCGHTNEDNGCLSTRNYQQINSLAEFRYASPIQASLAVVRS